jgi:hypothetical protein
MQRHSSAALPPLGGALSRRSSAILRQGSASIDIPYHRMHRSETAPALTDDLIAAAVAAAAALAPSPAASTKSGGGSGAPGSGRTSGGPSSGGSSYKGSPPLGRATPLPPCGGAGGGRPPGLPSLPERQASAARQIFEAQAEAVAAQAQAKVLQQALVQVSSCRQGFSVFIRVAACL